ncbi:MAG TPA: IS701 family transposase, partial [Thermoplasmata archaeon]|nr:IS701 family transposase [Thermoplasmata archaeon]
MQMFFTKNIDIFGTKLKNYSGCFSKPQWNHFNTYIHGLLLGEKGEKNIQDIADNMLDGRHQSSLNRFLTQHKWDVRQLNAIRLQQNLSHRDGGVLIVDDTIIEKSGKHMDGVGFLFHHCKGKSVRCHDIVSTHYQHRDQQVPLYFTPYVKEELAMQQDVWFKTKIQIALDLFRKSLMKVHPEVVVFDAWYMSKEIVDFLNNRSLTWVSSAKSNRLIQVDDTWISVSAYAKTLSKQVFKRINKLLGEQRFKWIYETTVVMKNIGLVKLVILRQRKNSKTCTFLVSNNTNLHGLKVLEYYKKRWSIEVFYRDCKQHLGMGEYQVRGLD